MKFVFLIYFSMITWVVATTRIEMVRNDQIVAFDEIVHPAETEVATGGHPNITVYLSDSMVQTISGSGKPVTRAIRRGEVVFRGPQAGLISDVGSTEVHFVRIEFLKPGLREMWETNGLASNYRVLIENDYARVYEVRIAAGAAESRHTHHDRVVVCLSGASLKHILPDGREENATLRTGDCVWRRGQTHVGQNLGKTELWVIAVEPK